MNNRNAKIEVLIGMIASGKSTYARRRADEGALIVSHDDLTEMLHGTYRYEPALKPTYRAMMRVLAWEAIFADRDVVIDRTHLDRDSRSFWVNAGRFFGVPVVAVLFWRESAYVHAERRFAADARGRTLEEWTKATLHHEQQADAEPLDWQAEGFDSLTEIRK